MKDFSGGKGVQDPIIYSSLQIQATKQASVKPTKVHTNNNYDVSICLFKFKSPTHTHVLIRTRRTIRLNYENYSDFG